MLAINELESLRLKTIQRLNCAIQNSVTEDTSDDELATIVHLIGETQHIEKTVKDELNQFMGSECRNTSQRILDTLSSFDSQSEAPSTLDLICLQYWFIHNAMQFNQAVDQKKPKSVYHFSGDEKFDPALF